MRTPRSGIRRVATFHELATTPFADGVNALCWERTLAGDFAEVVALLGAGEGVEVVDERRLRGLRASPAGLAAIDVLLEDQRKLRELGLEPELNIVREYERDEGPVPTDVFSFHVDRATEESDTWLCTYFGAPSEGLRNEEAVRRVDVPAIRAELLKIHGGADDDGFREFLKERSYDLHYEAVAGARPYSFGVGHLWRVAVEYPGAPVPPCIHRAPATPGPRLLLIS